MNVTELLAKNRSYRRFTPRAVTEEELGALIFAASQAGSGANMQQLRFVPVCGQLCDLVFPHLRWAGYLSDWDGPVQSERPTGYLVLLCPTGASGKWLVGVDTGIAAQSILLQATELGLGGCMFASADRPALLKALGVDQTVWDVSLVIALGEPLEQVRIVPVVNDDIKYYRDAEGVHYVPKRSVEELTLWPK